MITQRWLPLFLAVGVMSVSYAREPVGRSPYGDSAPAEVRIPNSRHFEFVSKVNGHRYAVNMALPFRGPPAEGYGVLYVIDGNWYFASAADAIRWWNAPDVLVVGIGYPEDEKFIEEVEARRGKTAIDRSARPLIRGAIDAERAYDLTLPVSQQYIDSEKFSFTAPREANFGGVDDFLRIVETEIKPMVESLVRVNQHNQVLFGDSFGGLAALHALFVEPNAFRTYIVASPSIWWGGKMVLAGEKEFAREVEFGLTHPHIIVTMGGDESRLRGSRYLSNSERSAARDDAVRRHRMVENAAELVAFLKTLHGLPDYRVANYVLFDRQHHGVSSWSALARGIVFAFPLKE